VKIVFGEHVLDPDRRELTRASGAIAIGPQVFDLLLYLLRHRERVVTKDDLIDAVWGGRIVSESTLTSHINAVRKAIGDTGDEQRLVRTIARKGYRFVGDVRETDAPQTAHPAGPHDPPEAVPVRPDRPSVAVLPFLNLSGDPAQEYFSDGITEDIITALSRVKWFFVIARNSSFTYKGRAVDVTQVAHELGVRYVLEGSVQRAGGRVRITGQLIQAETGMHIWADRFDGELADIFGLQDQVTASVVAAIEPSLRLAEIERARRKPTERLDAYDWYLRALPHFYTLTREGVDEALVLLQRAIAIDPRFALAKALAARSYAWRNPQGWAADPDEEKATAVRLGREALQEGGDDPSVLWMVGFAMWQLRVDLERALELYDRSLALNANCAQALALRGWALATAGRLEEATASLRQALRLSPFDPEAFFTMTALGWTDLMAGRLDEAVKWTSRALRERPGFAPALRFHAVSLVELGRLDEARDAVGYLLRLEPGLTASKLRRRAPIFDAKLMNVFLDGLRKAGLPE
jgi:TolB-like protein